MNAAGKRDQLEAALWRLGVTSWPAVDALLDLADAYATATASEVLDAIERDRRAARRRADLREALTKE